MQLVDRIRDWIENNDRGIMTVGVWVLVAFCFAVFICVFAVFTAACD